MTDSLDKLLTIGSTPDWISPLSAIFEDATNGPAQHFYISREVGYSVKDLTRLLEGFGVHVWGDMIIDDMIVFTVREAQARYAVYLLRRAGVPLLNAPASAAPKKAVALSNDFRFGEMALVAAPSLWGWLWRLWVKLVYR